MDNRPTRTIHFHNGESVSFSSDWIELTGVGLTSPGHYELTNEVEEEKTELVAIIPYPHVRYIEMSRKEGE